MFQVGDVLKYAKSELDPPMICQHGEYVGTVLAIEEGGRMRVMWHWDPVEYCRIHGSSISRIQETWKGQSGVRGYCASVSAFFYFSNDCAVCGRTIGHVLDYICSECRNMADSSSG